MMVALATPTPAPLETHDAFDWWANIWLPGASAVLTLVVAFFAGYIAWRTFNLQRTVHQREQMKERAVIARRLRTFSDDFLPLLLHWDDAPIDRLGKDLSTYVRDLPSGPAAQLGSILLTQMIDTAIRMRKHADLHRADILLPLVREWGDALTAWVQREAPIPDDLRGKFPDREEPL